MKKDGLVHVEYHEPLPKKFEATYLGNETHKEAHIRHEEQSARSKTNLVQIAAILQSKCKCELATAYF